VVIPVLAIALSDINAATATITNTGTIGSTTHTGDAIDLDFAGTTTSITNSGTVRTTSGNAIDVTAGDTLTTLTNSGTIAATTGKGVVAAGTITTLTNSGTISGTTGTTIDASGTVTTLTNSGTVSTTTGDAINVSGTVTTFTNSGTVSATTGEALVLGADTANTITNTGGTFTSANVTSTEGTVTVGAVDLVNTTITGGTIANTASGATNNAIYLSATAQTGTFTLNNVTVTGDITAGANAQLLKLDGTTAVAGNIAMGAGNDTLTLSGGSVTGTIDLEAGTNTVSIDDAFTTGGTFDATGGTAAITVASGGTFTVNHAVTTGAAALAVNSGGTLHLDGADVTNGGALTNAGTVKIDADKGLTVATHVASTGTYSFGVAGGSDGSLGQGLLTVSGGAADLTGSTIAVRVETGSGFIATNDYFKVVDGTGSVGGLDATTDDFTVTDDSYVLSFVITDGSNATVSGSANDAYLIATRASAASIGTNANNDAIATALASIDDTGVAGVDAVQGLLNDATTQAAANEVLEAVSPTVDMGAVSAATSVASGASNVISGRLAGVRGMGAAADELPNSVWVQGFGGVANQDERDSVAGYDANTVGVAIGSDMEVADGKGTAGAALSYGMTNVDSDNAADAETDVDSYQVSLYGDYDIGNNAYVEGVASYAWNSNDMTRHATSATTQNADYDSSLWNARAEVGRAYDVGADGLTLTPNVSANYWHYSADGYTETGTGALLTVGDSDLDALELGLGVDAKWSMMNEDGSKVEPVVRVGYSYDAIGDNLEVTSNFVGSTGTTFDTQGADPARSTFNVGAGVDFYSANNWQVKADYDFNIKSDYTAHTGMVRAGYRF
jgi:outer membrane autotransporter protein